MDQMYFVISNKAISLDEFGAAVIADVISDDGETAYVDWDTHDLIDWMDLTPTTYDLYKSAVDFLQQHQNAVAPVYYK